MNKKLRSYLLMPPKTGSRSGPPHNPQVRELVANKRKWASAEPTEIGKYGFNSWHERGFLPHRDEPGLVQFVTFHLADSFPLHLRSEWTALLEAENDQVRREQLHTYLDKGQGDCILKEPDCAKIVEDSLRYFHDQHYDLRAWVVMPNHVHVLFRVGDVSMSRIVEDWKGFTAHAINKALGRKGKLWFDDYWDTYMRDEAHEWRTRCYIETNPVAAFLTREARHWPWSSARHRDAYGRLCL